MDEEDVEEGHVGGGEMGVPLWGNCQAGRVDAMEALVRPVLVEEAGKVRAPQGQEVVQVPLAEGESAQDLPLAVGVGALAEELQFVGAQEQVGDEGGWGDAHGNAASLLHEDVSKLDVRDGEEAGKQGGKVCGGEIAGGGAALVVADTGGRGT